MTKSFLTYKCNNCNVQLRHGGFDDFSVPQAYFVHCPSTAVPSCHTLKSNLGAFCKSCFDLKHNEVTNNHVKDYHTAINIL